MVHTAEVVRADLSEQAMFIIRASNHNPNENRIPVRLKVTQTDSYFNPDSFDSSPRIFILNTANDTPFNVPTSDITLGIDDPNGEITVELLDSESGEYTLADAPNHKATATIVDGATPSVVISAPSYVVEGETFTFDLSTKPALTSGQTLAVNFEITHQGSEDYLNDFMPGTPANLSVTNKTQEIRVTTNEDLTDIEENGHLDIKITSGVGYVAASNTATRVIIQDKELIPTISIASTSGATIVEGETAVFELTAAGPDVTTDFPVTIEIERSAGIGDFLQPNTFIFNPLTTTVNIDATTDKGIFEIPTLTDTTSEANGTFTVTLKADPAASDATQASAYLVATAPNDSAIVTVQDNDTAGATTEVMVSAPSSAKIYESQDAVFTFTATPAPTGNQVVTVNYQLTEVGTFLGTTANTSRTGTIDIDADDQNGQVTLSLSTTPDSDEEDDGTLTIKVLPYTSGTRALTYNIGADYTASVQLIDDDDSTLPEITFGTLTTPISETAGNAEFTLNASAEGGAGDVNVDIVISQEGDFIVTGTQLERIIPVTRNDSDSFMVAIQNDDLNEPDGAVIATILP